MVAAISTFLLHKCLFSNANYPSIQTSLHSILIWSLEIFNLLMYHCILLKYVISIFQESLRSPVRRLIKESKTSPLTLLHAGRFSSNTFFLFNDIFIHSQVYVSLDFSTFNLLNLSNNEN